MSLSLVVRLPGLRDLLGDERVPVVAQVVAARGCRVARLADEGLVVAGAVDERLVDAIGEELAWLGRAVGRRLRAEVALRDGGEVVYRQRYGPYREVFAVAPPPHNNVVCRLLDDRKPTAVAVLRG